MLWSSTHAIRNGMLVIACECPFARRPEPVYGESMSHVTSHDSKTSIMHEQKVRGTKNVTNFLDGPILEDHAPACAHFHVIPEQSGPYDLSTFVPARAEPGELCARLVLPIHELCESPHYRAFLICVGRDRYLSTSGYRATILFSRREHWNWSEINGGIPLDVDSKNDLLYQDHETGRWRMATRVRVRVLDDLDDDVLKVLDPWRKLSISFLVAGGLEVSSVDALWQRAFRIHAVCYLWNVYACIADIAFCLKSGNLSKNQNLSSYEHLFLWGRRDLWRNFRSRIS